MADIFISYSKAERDLTKALADYLEGEGYVVWWDTNLIPLDNFRKTIDAELEAAKAVIVVWTPASIASEWVVAEAEHGARKNNLISLRTVDVEPGSIPKPYGNRQIVPIDDRSSILAALRKLGIAPRYAPGESLHDKFWAEVEKSNHIEEYELYLKRFPEGKHVAIAELKIARQRRAQPQERKQATPTGYGIGRRAFILISGAAIGGLASTYATSFGILPGFPEYTTHGAQNAREASAWNSALRKNLISAWRDFVEEYPNGQFSKAARDRINERIQSSYLIKKLEGHESAITEVLWRDEGRKLLSRDKSVAVEWDTTNEQLLKSKRETQKTLPQSPKQRVIEDGNPTAYISDRSCSIRTKWGTTSTSRENCESLEPLQGDKIEEYSTVAIRALASEASVAAFAMREKLLFVDFR